MTLHLPSAYGYHGAFVSFRHVGVLFWRLKRCGWSLQEPALFWLWYRPALEWPMHKTFPMTRSF